MFFIVASTTGSSWGVNLHLPRNTAVISATFFICYEGEKESESASMPIGSKVQLLDLED